VLNQFVVVGCVSLSPIDKIEIDLLLTHPTNGIYFLTNRFRGEDREVRKEKIRQESA
jgi:hypothetical protein